jgi:uncharacterized protein
MTIAPETVKATATRIAEHTNKHHLTAIELILHGGEPLLAGRESIREIVNVVRATVPARVDVRLQTNGVLLNLDYLRLFDELDIGVAVSLDGDERMHDRGRRAANGKGSYRAVAEALDRLTSPRFAHLFRGLLCLVDPRDDGLAAYEALLRFDPPAIDFLLPHGNWSDRPPGRVPDPGVTPYADWLVPVFDRWYRSPPDGANVRLFSEIMQALLGGDSHSEQVVCPPPPWW